MEICNEILSRKFPNIKNVKNKINSWKEQEKEKKEKKRTRKEERKNKYINLRLKYEMNWWKWLRCIDYFWDAIKFVFKHIIIIIIDTVECKHLI